MVLYPVNMEDAKKHLRKGLTRYKLCTYCRFWFIDKLRAGKLVEGTYMCVFPCECHFLFSIVNKSPKGINYLFKKKMDGKTFYQYLFLMNYLLTSFVINTKLYTQKY